MKKTMRIMAMLIMVGIFAACSNAQSGSNTGSETTATKQKQGNASIVGKWQGAKFTYQGKTNEEQTKMVQSFIYEFAKDGKLVCWINDKVAFEGTYTLEGDKLTMVGMSTVTATVTTLTKDKLVMEEDGKGTTEFERVK